LEIHRLKASETRTAGFSLLGIHRLKAAVQGGGTMRKPVPQDFSLVGNSPPEGGGNPYRSLQSGWEFTA